MKERQMNWEQKLQALNALVECSLKMRHPGDWYVSQSIDIKCDHILKSICGNGETPVEAINDHWQQATIDIEVGEYLIARSYWDGNVSRRMAVRWNGFMWDHVEEKTAAAVA
jgi:hypothetical protein